MADVPDNANQHCPGTQSDQAGKSSSCQGCPNQSVCASGKASGPDPDVSAVHARLSHVRARVLVLSGKGGVGKSTFSSHLAWGLAANPDTQVGVLDVDICGPSLPRTFNLTGSQVHQSSSGWSPCYVEDNLAVMSVGFLLNSPDDAVIWRGPKKNGLIKQFLKDVDWGELDFLVIDTPPGTSDEHLSLAQYLKAPAQDTDTAPAHGGIHVTGAVIVTTPQEVALLDVRKEINFCKKVGIPIIGVVENMSGFVCPKCHTETAIFPATTGGAETMCKEMDVPLLGKVPLDPRIARACDEGRSYFTEVPDSPATQAYMDIIEKIRKFCSV